MTVAQIYDFLDKIYDDMGGAPVEATIDGEHVYISNVILHRDIDDDGSLEIRMTEQSFDD